MTKPAQKSIPKGAIRQLEKMDHFLQKPKTVGGKTFLRRITLSFPHSSALTDYRKTHDMSMYNEFHLKSSKVENKNISKGFGAGIRVLWVPKTSPSSSKK